MGNTKIYIFIPNNSVLNVSILLVYFLVERKNLYWKKVKITLWKFLIFCIVVIFTFFIKKIPSNLIFSIILKKKDLIGEYMQLSTKMPLIYRFLHFYNLQIPCNNFKGKNYIHCNCMGLSEFSNWHPLKPISTTYKNLYCDLF